MKCRNAFGRGPRWLLLFVLCMLLGPFAAHAHRPDESYLYLIVNEGPLAGEFHIRISDMAKAVPLDADGDGTITDAEVEQNFDAITSYLSQQVDLSDETGSHALEFDGLRFFGRIERRHIVLDFRVPSLDPPPDTLTVEFRFLYEDIDPVHRPMLLMKSNTRMRLAYNEAHVTLEFEPGADSQSVSLVPPPFGQRVASTLQQGFLLILNNPYNILIAFTALLGSLRWYAKTATESTGAAHLAKNVAFVSLLLGIGFATGLLVQEYFPFRFSAHDAKTILGVSLGVAALANLLVLNTGARAAALLWAGGLSGVTMRGFGAVVGLNKGYIEIVYPGLIIGVYIACCALALAVLPSAFLLFRQSPCLEQSIRFLSMAVVGLAVLFLIQRLVFL